VPTFDDAARLALDLPGTTEGQRHGHRTWFVADKALAWERPFSQADLRRFGDTTPPGGPILATRTADTGDAAALLGTYPEELFTIPHFDGYAAVLVRMDAVTPATLEDVVVGAWLACAPRRLTGGFTGG